MKVFQGSLMFCVVFNHRLSLAVLVSCVNRILVFCNVDLSASLEKVFLPLVLNVRVKT